MRIHPPQCRYFLLEKLYNNLETRAINTADTTPISVVSKVNSRQYRRRKSIGVDDYLIETV